MVESMVLAIATVFWLGVAAIGLLIAFGLFCLIGGGIFGAILWVVEQVFTPIGRFLRRFTY